ncbi:hypothetical protein ACFO9E_13085 [Streptomyces maoxianensis]|uniref:Uncharacterized protein n=1 Tax=Streptomyces maoxianensis TaxID=1459942 RepID=A0ABV9G476_9ACTN
MALAGALGPLCLGHLARPGADRCAGADQVEQNGQEFGIVARLETGAGGLAQDLLYSRVGKGKDVLAGGQPVPGQGVPLAGEFDEHLAAVARIALHGPLAAVAAAAG